jgi:murein L,D-transpeptidase YafK
MKTRNILTYLFILLFLNVASVFASDVNVDKVIIEKKARRLTLLYKGQKIRVYQVALGRNPDGPKEREGDNKTPEGIYTVDSRNNKSRYHLSLHLSYPNPQDIQRAKSLGVSPGGNIMIHGIMNGLGWVGGLHRLLDWTKGCVAVTNPEIDEIAQLVPNGTTVEIQP